MSLTGVCQVCEAAAARHACDHCGRAVCGEHYDREVSACSQCAVTLRQAGRSDDGADRGGRDVDDDQYMR